ncbi:AMP-binding protein [Streptomyces sp. b94]|uniref:AMP-binding protein n=1 Tax=Streptomyces sp. b94 TaxID=1827634 RepID=UPI001B38894E|nr:AMP-binding protein [Streptomyces sp. b94]MBQ1098692.1 AMP-binding protein [Streptomyces sp. b94]
MFRSEYADVPPVDLPIHDAVLGRAAAYGDTPALIDGTDGTTLTYEQVDRFHRRVAAALAETGVRKGDVLALHSPNTVAFPLAFYAATRAGASVTMVHPLATAEEFAGQLGDSRARWIVTVSPLLDTARRAAELAGGVREILVCDNAPGHRSLTHPGIADAAVIGACDDDGNEVPHAYVVRGPAAPDLSENEIMMYVAERVAPYKRVRRVTFTDGVPRAASGKILRRELRGRS